MSFSHYYWSVSFISFNAGRGKEALVNYKTALQLNPNHTVALVNMGRHLRAEGNIQEAEQAYKRFVLRYRNTMCNHRRPKFTIRGVYQTLIIYERVSSETFRALWAVTSRSIRVSLIDSSNREFRKPVVRQQQQNCISPQS